MDPVFPWLFSNPRNLQLRDCTPRPTDHELNARLAAYENEGYANSDLARSSAMHMGRVDHMGNPIERGSVPYEYTLFPNWDEPDRQRSKRRRQSPSSEREDVSKPAFQRISVPRQIRADECQLLRVRFEKAWKEQLDSGLTGWSTNVDENRVKRAKLLDTLMEQTFDNRNSELVTPSKEIETMANCQVNRGLLYNEAHETAVIDALPIVAPNAAVITLPVMAQNEPRSSGHQWFLDL